MYCIYEESTGDLHSTTHSFNFMPLPDGLAYVEFPPEECEGVWCKDSIKYVERSAQRFYTKDEYLRKLGISNLSKIIKASQEDPFVAAHLELIKTFKVIDLSDRDYISGVEYLVTCKILTEEELGDLSV